MAELLILPRRHWLRMSDKAVALILARLVMAAVVSGAMPASHSWWGDPYPGDGQQAIGILIVFFFIGCFAASIFFLVGTLIQFALRRRRAVLTLISDLILFSVFVGVLAYGGLTAKYNLV